MATIDQRSDRSGEKKLRQAKSTMIADQHDADGELDIVAQEVAEDGKHGYSALHARIEQRMQQIDDEDRAGHRDDRRCRRRPAPASCRRR